MRQSHENIIGEMAFEPNDVINNISKNLDRRTKNIFELFRSLFLFYFLKHGLQF